LRGSALAAVDAAARWPTARAAGLRTETREITDSTHGTARAWVARMPTTSTAAQGLGAYVRHRPQDTLLYDVVRTHLEPFLAHAREHGGRPLPRYVAQAFRAYLRCGVLAHGFLRARCDGCGTDLLVAFSCKGRSVCPSCAARRMS